MWPYNNFNVFGNPTWGGGFNGGGTLPPWQSGGGQQTTPTNVPWWVSFGLGTFDRIGGFDWLGDWLGFPQNGDGSQNGGYPTTIGNNGNGASVLDQNMLVGFLNTSYQEDGEARKAILSYYQTLEGFIGTFLDWLSSLGLAAQIVARLKSGSIFAWPKLIQDLIILFAHDKDTANKQAPSLIPQLNQGSNVGPALGGNSLSQMLNMQAKFKPVTLPLVPREAYHVPKGYVLVRDPQTNQPAVVLKEWARAAGLYKGRAKAPIKASEWKAMKTASRIEKKLAGMLNNSSCSYKATKKTSRR